MPLAQLDRTPQSPRLVVGGWGGAKYGECDRMGWRMNNHLQSYSDLTLTFTVKVGADDEELLRNYPSLSKRDLSAAWAYYEQHREEGDRVIAALDEDGDD